jgi:hypothetical protein
VHLEDDVSPVVELGTEHASGAGDVEAGRADPRAERPPKELIGERSDR